MDLHQILQSQLEAGSTPGMHAPAPEFPFRVESHVGAVKEAQSANMERIGRVESHEDAIRAVDIICDELLGREEATQLEHCQNDYYEQIALRNEDEQRQSCQNQWSRQMTDKEDAESIDNARRYSEYMSDMMSSLGLGV